MSRRRAIISAIFVALGAIVYGVSPIDVIPELLTGPIGLTDDLAVFIGAGFSIWKLLSGSKPGPGAPPSSAGGAAPHPEPPPATPPATPPLTPPAA